MLVPFSSLSLDTTTSIKPPCDDCGVRAVMTQTSGGEGTAASLGEDGVCSLVIPWIPWCTVLTVRYNNVVESKVLDLLVGKEANNTHMKKKLIVEWEDEKQK